MRTASLGPMLCCAFLMHTGAVSACVTAPDGVPGADGTVPGLLAAPGPAARTVARLTPPLLRAGDHSSASLSPRFCATPPSAIRSASATFVVTGTRR